MPLESRSLSEVADIIVGFPFKSEEFNREGKGVKLVRGMNVTNGSFRWNEDSRWWNNLTPELNPYYLKKDDIIIGMDGSRVGKNYAMVQESDLPLLLVQRVACIRAKEGIDQDFLWSCISSTFFESYIDLVKTGTTIPHVSAKQIGEYPIPKIDTNTQRTVGYFSKMINTEIQLCQSINDNLSLIARTLYESCKMNSIHTLVPLSEVAIFNEQSLSKDDHFTEISYLDTSSITDNVVSEYQHLMFGIDEIPSRAKRLVQTNDVVFSTVRPNQKHFGILTSIPHNCIVSTGFTTISSINQQLSNEMIYLELSSEEVVSTLQQIAEQSTSAYPSIRPEDLESVKIPIFSDSTGLVQSLRFIYQLIDSNNKECNSLRSVRDYLLPKLMSGCIDVSTLDLPTKYSFSTSNPEHGQDHQRGAESEADRKD